MKWRPDVENMPEDKVLIVREYDSYMCFTVGHLCNARTRFWDLNTFSKIKPDYIQTWMLYDDFRNSIPECIRPPEITLSRDYITRIKRYDWNLDMRAYKNGREVDEVA